MMTPARHSPAHFVHRQPQAARYSFQAVIKVFLNMVISLYKFGHRLTSLAIGFGIPGINV